MIITVRQEKIDIAIRRRLRRWQNETNSHREARRTSIAAVTCESPCKWNEINYRRKAKRKLITVVRRE